MTELALGKALWRVLHNGDGSVREFDVRARHLSPPQQSSASSAEITPSPNRDRAQFVLAEKSSVAGFVSWKRYSHPRDLQRYPRALLIDRVAFPEPPPNPEHSPATFHR